jgi:hypothetical protein
MAASDTSIARHSTGLRARDGVAGSTVVVLTLFYVAMLVPVILHAGPYALPPSRIFLICAFFPLLVAWIIGAAGRVRSVDILVVFLCLWMTISYLVNHPFGTVIEKIGYTTLETLGGFLVGRVLIRSAKDYLTFVRLGFLTLVLMLPFGLLETQTGDPIIILLLDAAGFDAISVVNHDVRLGLERAQVVFPHPILYGVFAAGFLGIIAFGLNHGASLTTRVWRLGVVTLSVIASVSSGALVAWSMQIGLMAYDRIFRALSWRWTLFGLGLVFAYIVIDILSNRTPIHVFISYLTLNVSSGYNRIRIFTWGMENVTQNPIFGLGLNDWIRPRWMKSSVDNFWLVVAMRHGIPQFLAFAAIVAIVIFRLSRLQPRSALRREIRAGYLISLGGLIVALVTVHIWDSLYVWFMAFLGASVWMFEPETREDEPDEDADGGDGEKTPVSRYSRFPVRRSRGGAVVARATETGRKRSGRPAARRHPA